MIAAPRSYRLGAGGRSSSGEVLPVDAERFAMTGRLARWAPGGALLGSWWVPAGVSTCGYLPEGNMYVQCSSLHKVTLEIRRVRGCTKS